LNAEPEESEQNSNPTTTKKAFCEKNRPLEIDYSGNEIRCLGVQRIYEKLQPNNARPLRDGSPVPTREGASKMRLQLEGSSRF
jgi:hypothetical protein